MSNIYVPPDGLWDYELEDKPESYLHKYFHATIKDDFYTAHEVEGFCFLPHEAYEGQRVIADFMLYPRPHLVELGFVETWFAVEIKKTRSRFSKAAKQAFGYNFSRFRIKNREVAPAFSLVWIPAWKQITDLRDPGPDASKEEIRAYKAGVLTHERCIGERHAFAYMNIGSCEINRGRYKWSINFSYHAYSYQLIEHDKTLRVPTVCKNRKRFTARIGNSNVIDIASGLGEEVS